MRMPVPVVAALSAILFSSSAAAQETRVAPEDHVPPPAQLEDVAWLAGEWSGSGIGGAAAHEAWLPPTADTMVGLFVQEDGESGLMFTEHMYIREVEGSLALSLKHFNPDLTGWEEKDDMVTFRLVAAEHCALYFSGLTYRCTNGENTDDGMLVAVRMRGNDGAISELVFNFDRVGEAPATNLCPDADTTVDMDQCYAEVLDRADATRARYLAAAQGRFADRPELAEMIGASDEAFTAYRDAECGAVLQNWIDGTIRGVMTLGCRIAMTDARTHEIWDNWLTFPDSTPAILPEPGPTR